ncbi:heterokaryon incompatibility protein-domain-containing protein [Alternaria rosae]|uniref:heterokaryon incompatibility protein-domain-containing protein n=1 Tax=Alternaria rosae TaxID=1187941 RepID=UPI001E8E39E2|nr:heterokaryon incompatibility protein-domain-containing protein [Alternaria rosae]KAH6868034.1 heterokaryon incompatibility protein-domain-containing protein [Alternaria rosae]
MRLLNVNTRQLEEFFGDAIPPYAILSHTWGNEEVILQDLSREGHQQKQGYAKIEGCCQQAIKDGLAWVWVDTCCIDKTSSAELSEAINSMYRWYEHSKVCYAYLQDVPSGSDVYENDSAFRKSRWFTRGWTLQELIAPGMVLFYDTNWMLISPMHPVDEEWIHLLSVITAIDEKYLQSRVSLRSASAACKFSWMAGRSTTRVEDEAYCLLGLLDINMPLLYGEGYKAFFRLQEAVLSGSDDISLLGWGYKLPCVQGTLLAKSPAAFSRYPNRTIFRQRRAPRTHSTMTGHGLHIELLMFLIDAREKIWTTTFYTWALYSNNTKKICL